MNESDKVIQKQFDSLPLEVKEAIGRTPWKERVKSISDREALNAERAEALETETMLVLYGFTPADDYQANIVREVGVDEDTAERIVKEVSEEIFADIEKQYELIEATANVPKEAPKQESKPDASADFVVEGPVNKPSMPEAKPNNLPEALPGETAHDVPRAIDNRQETIDKKGPMVQTPAYTAPPSPTGPIKTPDEGAKRPDLSLPKSDYPSGQDPYHEPL